ncbi:MAG TPA: alkaline phosphatase family protein [Candidatus Angelobacter sp.]|nr:alkaline phosphatase family protein [Candidatus Angelobacter sp.]
MADPNQHVVVLIMENRSFDQMLGCMKAVYPNLEGVDPAHPLCNPDLPTTNPPICQADSTARTIQDDPNHDLANVLRQIQGPCQGFITDFALKFPQSKTPERQEVMGVYPRGFLPALHALAENFALCDHWFSSLPGPTWPNRFFVHSGTSLGHVTMPSGIFHPNLHLYDQTTLYDRLHAKDISWKIYYGDVPQSLVMIHQWKYPFNYSHMPNFFTDVQGAASQFPAFVFIEPTYFGANQNDQHPPTDVLKGDILMAQVYNALRANAELWSTTLLIVLCDEHGGFADHVYPPAAVPPDQNTKEYAFNQYGVRVPAILASPWIAAGVIAKVFDHTSILKYAIDKWQLDSLGARATAANSLAPFFANAQRDTPATIPVAQLPVTVEALARTAAQAQPLNANQEALLSFTQYLETQLAQVEPPSEVARRAIAFTGGPVPQAVVAQERVEKFLAYRRNGSL